MGILEDLFEKLNETDLDFLNDFRYPSLSIVISTFNRCPFKPSNEKTKNPLEWNIESTMRSINFLERKIPYEIIIVDDHSSDFTAKVLERLREEYPNIKVIRNKGKEENPLNIGIRESKGKVIKIQSDDSILHPLHFPVGLWTFDKLKKMDKRTAVLKVACYERRTYPVGITRAENIGRVKLFEIKSNFDYWPEEYMPEPPYLSTTAKIVRPFRITNLAGERFCDAKILKEMEIGGKDVIEMGYGTETLHAMDLCSLGYSIYFSPDPKASVIHLRFGDADFSDNDSKFSRFFNLEKERLEEMIALSSKAYDLTGCRRKDGIAEEWLYKRLRNYGYLMLKKYSWGNFLGFSTKNFFNMINGNDLKKNYRSAINIKKRLSIYFEAMRNAILGKKRADYIT